MRESNAKPIAMIFNGVWSQYAVATAPKYRDFIEMVYVRDLARAQLDRFEALLIPFQNDHRVIAREREALYAFLASGKKIAVFGDADYWIDAQWEDRPVNNYWWAEDATKSPFANTRFEHPLFAGLSARQACWHYHGVYTRIPSEAEVLQNTASGEVICWQTQQYGGTLLAATSDPIVEHGVQQIQHLDHFVDHLVAWLCGTKPAPEKMSVDASAYGIEWERAAVGAGGALPRSVIVKQT